MAKRKPLAARIKKLMQADEDVGKIAQATPVCIAKAMEMFLDGVCKKTTEIAQQRNAKTVTASHLKACIHEDDKLDFLKELVHAVPELGPMEETPKGDKPKGTRRRRTKTEEDEWEPGDGEDSPPPKRKRARAGEGGRGRGRGRGRGGRGAKDEEFKVEEVDAAAQEAAEAAAEADVEPPPDVKEEEASVDAAGEVKTEGEAAAEGGGGAEVGAGVTELEIPAVPWTMPASISAAEAGEEDDYDDE